MSSTDWTALPSTSFRTEMSERDSGSELSDADSAISQALAYLGPYPSTVEQESEETI